MKIIKIYFSVLLVFYTLSASAQLFQENKFTLGASYGTNIKSIGLQFGGRSCLTDHFATDINAIMFLTEEEMSFEININPCYYFNTNDLRPYVFIGLNDCISTLNEPSLEDLGKLFGFNLGGGIEYNINRLDFYLEPKYTINHVNQFYICAGFRIIL